MLNVLCLAISPIVLSIRANQFIICESSITIRLFLFSENVVPSKEYLLDLLVTVGSYIIEGGVGLYVFSGQAVDI